MTATTKIQWKLLARGGEPYGHVPGHSYHDVDIHHRQTTAGRHQVRIREVWGSAQGDDEEHGRNEWIGSGPDLESALDEAVREARPELEGDAPKYLSSARAQVLAGIE